MSLLAEAIAWHAAGYMPLPLKTDGSKAPAVPTWTQYQKGLPPLEEIIELFKIDTDGIGLLCGAVSGGLEMLELEGRAVEEGLAKALEDAFRAHNESELHERLYTTYMEGTPSGGVHFYYRIAGHSLKNRKLARRPATNEELAENPKEKQKVLIETRGEGGFTVIAPSGGRSHSSGNPWWVISGNRDTIITITADERDTIHAIASTLDQMPLQEPPPPPSRGPLSLAEGLRPGDDFNQRATWKEILEPHGWTVRKHYGGNLYGWAKPGKVHPGISATTGRNDADRLFVFSTSTEFDSERPYSKFGAYALLNHGGDHSAAARDLRAGGYGSTAPKEPAVIRPQPVVIDGTAAIEPEPENELDKFWSSRSFLTHIREFALARMMPPWAVLGVCLLRQLAVIPPHVVLPPILGGYGSLNLFAALVAPSGMGKGGSDRAARDCIHFVTPDLQGIYTAPVGSGEGIAHQYAHRERGGIVRDRDSVLFEVPEVDTLTALGGRQGSTLLSQLRLAFSGERLGFGYADAIKRIPIEADSYRLCLSVGVQPERAGSLIWDADGGTPQRFIWFPAQDPQIKAAGRPEAPPALVIEKREFERTHLYNKYHVLKIPESVEIFVLEQQEKRHAGDVDALDAHSIFAREKVAQALTFLDYRTEMTEEDWELSGVIMMVSGATRNRVVAELDRKLARTTEAQAKRQATRETIVEQQRNEHAIARVCSNVLKKASSNGGIAWSDLRGKIAQRDRDLLDEAIEKLLDGGLIQVLETPKGRHIAMTNR